MAGSKGGIVLYHYPYSPYARRVVWYLALRGIEYSQCTQPAYLPRPDLKELLGIHYRRIPVLAIGRDVYCDTRIILAKLETLFPGSELAPRTPEAVTIQKLLSAWIIESGIFVSGSQLIPSDLPLMRDPRFQRDREDFSGRSWEKSKQDQLRPEALANIRRSIHLVETTLLADGRDWILATSKPTLADIEGMRRTRQIHCHRHVIALLTSAAIWVFHWLKGLKGALPSDIISQESYPKVFAWMARFDRELQEAHARAPKPTNLKGAEAAKQVEAALSIDAEPVIDAKDPLGLQANTIVEVWPIDSGSRHRDVGTLLGLDIDEVVIGVKTQNGQEIRLHFPRQQFRIRAVSSDSSARL